MHKILLFIFIYVFFPKSAVVEKGNVEVRITGMKDIKGTILATLFISAEGFPSEQEKAYKYKEVKVEGDTAFIVFKEIPYGTCAISLFHDVNNNKKLDTNMIGIPKEGLGTTNNKKPLFRAPSFEEAKFELVSNVYKADIQLIYF
ncbi:MAG: DUF2141 domain-containing protein [Bacteroidota bacterium]|nr:DUF2141 domain-containing protein [Bacteroidota bacterium]